jgi:hypothetical protein
MKELPKPEAVMKVIGELRELNHGEMVALREADIDTFPESDVELYRRIVQIL